MTWSQFEQAVLKTSEIWKQCSHEVRSHLSAQNVGIGVWAIRDSDSTLSVRIYDIEPSRDPRRLYFYDWSIPMNNTNTTVLESSGSSFKWTQTRDRLIRALENHVGAVDQNGSLVMLSRPRPHTLHFAFKKTERIFAYDKGIKSHPVSIILDRSALVSPIPGVLIESDVFMSLAMTVWRWWQQEQGLRNEALSRMVHVRIMYVHWSFNYCLY